MFSSLSQHFAEITRRVLPHTLTAPDCGSCGESVGRFCFMTFEPPVEFLCFACAGKFYELKPAPLWEIVKKTVGCEVCGYAYESFALHADHLNPAEKYRNSKTGKVVEYSDLMRGCSLKTGMAESNKVQILCANHHAEKTVKERRLAGLMR
jgi:hypothetical protein